MTSDEEKVRAVYTMNEWHAEGIRRFGRDEMQWRFICPACGVVTTPADWKAAGAREEHVAFSCVGRFMDSPREAFAAGPGPCNYAGGGLFGLNPITITGRKSRYFDFAPTLCAGMSECEQSHVIADFVFKDGIDELVNCVDNANRYLSRRLKITAELAARLAAAQGAKEESRADTKI